MLSSVNQGILPLGHIACQEILSFKVQPFRIIYVQTEIWGYIFGLMWTHRGGQSEAAVIRQFGLRRVSVTPLQGAAWLLRKPQPGRPLRQGDPAPHVFMEVGRGSASPPAASETESWGMCLGSAQVSPCWQMGGLKHHSFWRSGLQTPGKESPTFAVLNLAI